MIFKDKEENYINPTNAWSHLKEKYNEILDIQIFDFERQYGKKAIINQEINKIYGVYGTKLDSKNTTGGPFITYIIKNIKSNDLLIATGFVNSPGKNKVFHLKELEYILNTIEQKGNKEYE